jgi:hypothetical protein
LLNEEHGVRDEGIREIGQMILNSENTVFPTASLLLCGYIKSSSICN